MASHIGWMRVGKLGGNWNGCRRGCESVSRNWYRTQVLHEEGAGQWRLPLAGCYPVERQQTGTSDDLNRVEGVNAIIGALARSFASQTARGLGR